MGPEKIKPHRAKRGGAVWEAEASLVLGRPERDALVDQSLWVSFLFDDEGGADAEVWRVRMGALPCPETGAEPGADAGVARGREHSLAEHPLHNHYRIIGSRLFLRRDFR